MLIWFSAGFWYQKAHWLSGSIHFFVMTGETLMSSLHHKPSSHKHKSVRVNIHGLHFQSSTQPSSTWLCSLQTTNGSVFYCNWYIPAVVTVVLKTLLEPVLVWREVQQQLTDILGTVFLILFVVEAKETRIGCGGQKTRNVCSHIQS